MKTAAFIVAATLLSGPALRSQEVIEPGDILVFKLAPTFTKVVQVTSEGKVALHYVADGIKVPDFKVQGLTINEVYKALAVAENLPRRARREIHPYPTIERGTVAQLFGK